MKIELSLTYKLINKLPNSSKLVKSTNTEPNFNHYYADLFMDKNKGYVLLFNSLNSWMCFIELKDFKKDPLNAIKEGIKKQLLNEDVKEYIINSFLNDIDELEFTKTSNKSIRARMSTSKKDVTYIYDNFISAPSLATLINEIGFNRLLHIHPFIYDKYILPIEEMGKHLLINYINAGNENKLKEEYRNYILNSDYDINTIKDYSSLDNEDLAYLLESEYPEIEVLINQYLIMNFYIEHPNPELLDHLQFIQEATAMDKDEHVDAYLKLFNIPKDIYIKYKQTHNKSYRCAIL